MAITCDACKTKYEDEFEIQAFVCIAKTGSYGNIFGDGVFIECDICQYCLKERLVGAMRISECVERA